MTSRAPVIAALVAGCLLVTACGGDAGTTTDPPSAASSTSVSASMPSTPTGSSATAAATLTVVGRIVLVGPYSDPPAGGDAATCAGTGGFSDLRVGARITVTDATDATVGIGSVGSAVARGTAGSDQRTCEFSFGVDDVRRGSAPYKVRVARRDSPTFTEDELGRPVVLTLGNA